LLPSETTISGVHSVPLKTIGHDKGQFTVLLTAKADGTKLVIFKGKGTRLMKSLEKIPGIVIRFSKNGWMNNVLTIEYLDNLIGAFLVGARSSFQAADVAWNVSLKQLMRSHYDVWPSQLDNYEYTRKGGNVRPPYHAEWVKSSWEEDSEQVMNPIPVMNQIMKENK